MTKKSFLMETFFNFLSSDDTEEVILSDLKLFLSSGEWNSFVSSLLNENKNSKFQISLSSLIDRITHRLINKNYPFVKYDPSILVDAFVAEKNIPFLIHSLSLSFQERSPAIPFIERLVEKESKLLMSLDLAEKLPPSQQTVFIHMEL